MLTKSQMDEVEKMLHAEDAPTLDDVAISAMSLLEDLKALREIAKHAARHARGEEDGKELVELLDKTGDPDLMFTR